MTATNTRKIDPATFLRIPVDVFAKHQIKIARSTLKMNDIGIAIMGGMTKNEAREILKKYSLKE